MTKKFQSNLPTMIMQMRLTRPAADIDQGLATDRNGAFTDLDRGVKVNYGCVATRYGADYSPASSTNPDRKNNIDQTYS